MEQNIYSVAEITRHIKNLFERNLPAVAIEGEISNYKAHYSGHAYFSVKDDHAQISAVMWRSAVERSGFNFTEGAKVICYGQITVYEKTGRYQIIVNRIEESGKGDLHQQFEELKRKLAEKGYFDESRKRKIPMYPQRIGIVTSPTGAAIEDMISVSARRNKSIELFIRPAKVQGINSAQDIANGVYELNKFGQVDVIVIGRGGGSLEDLWAFNEEVVADAIYNSTIPVVSAVGHEIDYSISDFVADRRAATPSAAMEILIPDMSEMIGQLNYFKDKSYQLIYNFLTQKKSKVDSLKTHYALKKPEVLIDAKRQQLNSINEIIEKYIIRLLSQKTTNLISIKKHVNALGPQNILNRGYSIIFQDSNVVNNSEMLNDGEIDIMFKDKKIKKVINSR